jgi:hypothetical protein
MKNLILFILFGVRMIPSGQSQDTDFAVIATAGAQFNGAGVELDWTLGEVMIHTLESNSTMISQGFHQPSHQLVAIKPLPDKKGILQAWPNPFNEEFELSLSLSSAHHGEARIFDMTGKLWWSNTFADRTWHKRISTSSLVPGLYVLQITLADDASIYSYPMIKAQ